MKLTLLILSICIMGCQKVVIGETEAGVHFKKFGGGVDTSQYFDTGRHSINPWDRVIKYDTSEKTNTMDFTVESDSTITINYTYQLTKSNTAKYHDVIGGDPSNFAERALREVIKKLSQEELADLNSDVTHKLSKAIADEMDKYFIELRSVAVSKN